MVSSNVHLCVIQHGLWGSPQNTSYLASTLAKYHGGTVSPNSKLQAPESVDTIEALAADHPNATRSDVRLVVLNSGVNPEDRTYDGVDWCGERLVKEIYTEVLRLETEEAAVVTKFSIIGYSLGGLIARYAVGLLFSQGFFINNNRNAPKATNDSGQSSTATSSTLDDSTNDLSFKSRPKPVSFSTIATPHLGVTSGSTTFSKFAKYVGSSMLGRSGKQLYLADRGWTPATSHASSDDGEDQSGLCLLEAMADERFSFLKALRQFERIDLYANAIADLTVSYRTAALEPHDPFVIPEGLILERDPEHSALLTSFKAVDVLPAKKPFVRRLASSLHPKNLPWILNPQRFPLRFPLNYVAFLGLPVILPVMFSLVLHKLNSQSKTSYKRVGEFERLWAIENGHLDAEDLQGDAAGATGNGAAKADTGSVVTQKSKDDKRNKSKPKPLDPSTLQKIEKTRFAQLLAMAEAEAEDALREVGEDNVAEKPTPYERQQSQQQIGSTANTTAQDEEATPSASSYVVKPNKPTMSLSESYHLDPKEPPLTPTQLRICSKFNDPVILPQLKKHLAHFEDILNAHPVIIVRSQAIEAHRKGIPLVKAFVERFPL